jgi:hypothetical protein
MLAPSRWLALRGRISTTACSNISWDLTGTGLNLLGVYVYGGSRGANLYKVDDLAQLIAGSAIINTPLTGNSGKYATISHVLFLGTSGHSVPEGGSTMALLALAIGGICVVQRKLSLRSGPEGSLSQAMISSIC